MYQLEVLVNHSDTKIERIVRALDVDFLSPYLYHTLVCMIEAEENTHKSGLSCAVLTEDGVDFSLFHLQCYVVVGDDTRELLADPDHFDYVTHLISKMRRADARIIFKRPPGHGTRRPISFSS